MTKQLQSAFRFFHANAGGVVGEAAIGAIALARAEAWAQENDLEFRWNYDNDVDLSWCESCEHLENCKYRVVFGSGGPGCKHVAHRGHEHECLDVYVEHDGFVESLGGIVDADHNYQRLIEAELALELMGRVLGTRRLYAEAWAD